MTEPTPIPAELHSAYEEGPFTRCSACGADLSDPTRVYQVHKAWRSGEVVFELALCADCAAATVMEFSQESLERIQEFLAKNLKPSPETGCCHVCGKAAGPDTDFEMAGVCRGSFLLRPITVVCADCSEASQDLLSKKTRDAWGDFVDRNLPGVPEEMEPIPFTL